MSVNDIAILSMKVRRLFQIRKKKMYIELGKKLITLQLYAYRKHRIKESEHIGLMSEVTKLNAIRESILMLYLSSSQCFNTWFIRYIIFSLGPFYCLVPKHI